MNRAVYSGRRRKLILAFDVGTTFSGISYCILDPGHVPEIKGVTRFPADELSNGSSKIPTVIYYDRSGEKVCAVGAEALRESVQDIAADEGWVKAEWFKLRLRPSPEESMHVGDQLPPLPLNKSCIEVFADFLKYLFQCASSYIKDAHANGEDVWSSVEKETHFVLTHPNGWEGFQQCQMREAAVLAGLISDTPDEHTRITFVTEGEASLHFAIENGLSAKDIKKGYGVIVVDAGGGTIDVSTYGKGADEESFEEITAPECHFHGSIFVSVHARVFLNEYLAESPFIDDLDDIVRCFDSTTKLRFRSEDEYEYIKFGSTRENDYDHEIRFGQLKLAGSDIRTFFEPSVRCIINTIIEQRKSAQGRVSHVVLVGGFAASNWLRNEVQRSLKPFRVNIFRPDNSVSKAVSDGAISFHLNNFVRSRVSKVAYGISYAACYDSKDPEHLERSSSVYKQLTGVQHVSGAFSNILPAKTAVSETTEYRSSFLRVRTEKSTTYCQPILCYRGELAQPKWLDVDPGQLLYLLVLSIPPKLSCTITYMYKRVCDITADLSCIKQPPLPRGDGTEGSYYAVTFDVILLFGLTELQAQIAWKQDGVEKRTPAQIIYAPRSTKLH